MNTGISLADGQVAATATALASNLSGLVNVTFANVGGLTETLVITLARGTGTARRIARIVLAANEQFVLAGLPINAADTLKASTSNAASVDYVITSAPDGAPLWYESFDANGALKQVNSGFAGNVAISGDLIPQFSSAAADGAITQKSGTVYITKATAAALTIADPTTITDDGKTLTVISATAAAHTLSNAAGSGFNAGGAATDVGTYGGAKGDNIVLTAKGGVWLVTSKVNVTLG